MQYTSEIYTLTSRSKPYAVDVKIKSSTAPIINSTVASSNVLTAYYAYTDSDLNTDSSIVTWYDWSSGIKTFINTGNTLAASFVTTGKLISYSYAGTSGVATVELQFAEFKYIDLLSLLKINDQWKIVCRVYSRVESDVQLKGSAASEAVAAPAKKNSANAKPKKNDGW